MASSRTSDTSYSSIIVSNRLPVSVSKVDGKLTYSLSSGGLATALSSVGDDSAPQLWIGWPGIASDDLTTAEKAAITRKLKSYGCFPVFLTKMQVQNFYEGYANDTLWPLFHYFQSLAVYDEAYWVAYKQVSQLFKKAIMRQADPQARVWIHDYHLMLLPKELRAVMPKAAIGFFLHIPFPSFEIFRLLPQRKEIVEGLLGADLIGFHVYDYARHFQSSVLRILGIDNSHGLFALDGRTVRVEAFPIGIDYEKFKATLDDPITKAEMHVLQEHFKGKKIILSVDRLDYSKGILERLDAYELLLKENPAMRKKVVLVMVAVPSRTEVEAYKDLRDTIERSISRINGAFASVDWTPISYQFKNLPMESVVALYAQAAVALVTPLRDGMNLVAKEFVASKQKRDGVLILSEMAGAIDELPEALAINPNDVRSIVRALKLALRMPKKEQRARLDSMKRRLSRYNVQRWAADFMDQLGNSQQLQTEHNQKTLTAKVKQTMAQDFALASTRLICLDYDGTLRHFVSSHEAHLAKPPKTLMRLIEKLVAQPNTKLAIVSGRPREVMESWFGHLPVSLAAEHGGWIKDMGEWSQTNPSFREHKKTLLPVLQEYVERTPGAQVEEKTFAIVWHFRNVATELAYVRNTSLRHDVATLLINTDIGVHTGNKIIEIKPRNINKGIAVNELLAMNPAEFVMAIGDDYTDEDMFEILPEEAYTIKVGPGETLARYRVASVDDVIDVLKALSSQAK